MTEAERITRALEGQWHGSYGIALCPAHQDTRPSLSLADGDGGQLLAHCHAGCGFSDVLGALKSRGLVARVGQYAPPLHASLARFRQAAIEHALTQEARALAVWREAQPIGGTIAESYLRRRGVKCDLPDTLRFLAECTHPTGARLPALVALVEGVARVAIHRTYLCQDGAGKATIEPAKAMLGAVAGGSVLLSKSGQALVVCEGLETGLSLASGLLTRPATIAAALSTSGMRRLELPNIPGKIVIATDGDPPGRNAGNELATRAAAKGWKVSLLPAPDGQDWNDVLVAGRAA